MKLNNLDVSFLGSERIPGNTRFWFKAINETNRQEEGRWAHRPNDALCGCAAAQAYFWWGWLSADAKRVHCEGREPEMLGGLAAEDSW